MTSISIPSAKLTVVFKAGSLPAIDPADPRFILRLASVVITGQCNARAARKLAIHPGGAVLTGKLVEQAGGKLVLLDAGFQFLDQQPAATPAPGQVAERKEAATP